MLSLADPGSTLGNKAWMDESSSHTAHINFNVGSSTPSAWAQPLNRESCEEGNDGMHPNMEQVET